MMTKNDDFGDRMKSYEAASTSLCAYKTYPMIARLDGSGFSKLTKGLDKPYDIQFLRVMQLTAEKLAEAFNAKIAYVQSDEISLLFTTKDEATEFAFGGRFQKFQSLLAARGSVFFYKELLNTPSLHHLLEKTPIFDCRVFQVPNITEAMNAFLWRQQDCIKNAISMVAQANFSPSELHKKSGLDKIKMLKEKNIQFDSLPAAFKFGTFFYKTPCEIEIDLSIPEKYRPEGPITRNVWVSNSFQLKDWATEENVNFFNNLI